ncbi:hypothetical protein AVEN_9349-1 [Araneus ventricosus]|uniref:Uncharacterized protein n=1 Tax=Araneus ventricosus TaxID=182803 RepID=A0A4Y2DJ80_ARAVE|nr:hypothetical protein AVEN_9349-1 [Araneus ventricosus]
MQLDAIWWNPTLEIKRSRVRALRRRFQATREKNERLQRKIKYKREYEEYKLMIKKAKREFMIEFLEKITQKNSMGVVKNILKDKRLDIKMALIIQDNGELTRHFSDSRDYVLRNIFPWLKRTYECRDIETGAMILKILLSKKSRHTLKALRREVHPDLTDGNGPLTRSMDKQFEKLFAMMAEMKAGQEKMRVAQVGLEQKMEAGQKEMRVAQAGLEQKMEAGQEEMRSG